MDENNKKSFGSKQIDDENRSKNSLLIRKLNKLYIIIVALIVVVAAVYFLVFANKQKGNGDDFSGDISSQVEKDDAEVKSIVFKEGYEAAHSNVDEKISRTDNEEELFSLYMQNASLYLEQNEFDQAIDYSNKALSIGQSKSYHVFSFQSDIYSKKGDKAQALEYLDKAQNSLNKDDYSYDRRIMYIESIRRTLNE